MKNFFEAIASFCETVLFIPFNYFRETELESWAAAHAINWLLMIVGAAAIIYLVLQLKKLDSTKEDRKDITSHSYL
jgi:hypothetical protein